jgi:hypothetical protein
VNGLTLDHTGTGFRTGAINTIIDHPLCDYKHAVMRSGHDNRNICSVFEYMYASPSLVAIAGKVLAQYPHPGLPVQVPRLTFVNDENKIHISNFITQLFDVTDKDFSANGRLWPFAEALLAVFIMHFEQFFADCGANHVVIARFLSTCTVFNITIDSLRLWSREIRQDFKTNNENYHKDVNIENTNENKTNTDILIDKTIIHMLPYLFMCLMIIDKKSVLNSTNFGDSIKNSKVNKKQNTNIDNIDNHNTKEIPFIELD